MIAAQTMALNWQQPWDGRDAAQVLSLFCLTVEEQQARWHTIQLLSEYLASGTARKREVIAKELKACRQLYEAVWAEMECAHYSTVVEKNKAKHRTNPEFVTSRKVSSAAVWPILADGQG